jgi:hypothetical protein
MGKPASITSTPSFSSWRAISSFSSRFRVVPAACSPSLRVVSKIIMFFMFLLLVFALLLYSRATPPPRYQGEGPVRMRAAFIEKRLNILIQSTLILNDMPVWRSIFYP